MKYIFLASCLLLTGCNTYLGMQGATGLPGKDGTSCFVSQTLAGAIVICSDGTTATIANGASGQDGDKGDRGDTGNVGAPGTQIQIVQFCGGTTTYPTTFVEVGFCINNELWAVFSENNGFLVKVPPGQYQSHGHNSSCTFTVASNCVVSH